MIAYLGSPSKGDRHLLRYVQSAIASCGVLCFAPCLGFNGKELPVDRMRIMTMCFQNLAHSDFMVALVDTHTSGVFEEIDVALKSRLPVAIFIPSSIVDKFQLAIPHYASGVSHFSNLNTLRSWIYELQENRRNPQSGENPMVERERWS